MLRLLQTQTAALGCLLFLSLFSHPRAALCQQMVFEAEPPPGPVQIFGSAWKIYAVGEIDNDAPRRFEKLVRDLNIPQYSRVSFNSPGGSPVAAMELGRLIRKLNFNTNVYAKNDSTSICLSACTLAFLGGKFRYLEKDALYGVHRFFFKSSTPDDVGLSQILSSLIVAYIKEMGSTQELFSEMTMAGSDEMNPLSRKKLEELNVINNGFGDTSWTIESVEDKIYLRGARDTVYGINKILIYCDNGGPLLHVIFDPQGRSDEVLKMSAQSLMLDYEPISIADSRIGKAEVHNGWINAHYRLSRTHVSKLLSAKRVGVAFQFSYEAPVFLGFDSMEFESAKEKFRGLLSTCRR